MSAPLQSANTSDDMELIRRVNARDKSYYSNQEIHNLRGRILNGESVLQVSSSTGMSIDTVYSYIGDILDVIGRKKCGPPKSSINRDELVEKISRGISYGMIAKPYGMTRQAITMYLRRNPLTDAEQSFIDEQLRATGKVRRPSKRA